jgi:hypothetical protein
LLANDLCLSEAALLVGKRSFGHLRGNVGWRGALARLAARQGGAALSSVHTAIVPLSASHSETISGRAIAVPYANQRATW